MWKAYHNIQIFTLLESEHTIEFARTLVFLIASLWNVSGVQKVVGAHRNCGPTTTYSAFLNAIIRTVNNIIIVISPYGVVL